jgi:DNA-binding GntR family transcriptional regulator
MTRVDRASPIPAYYQVALDIRNRILKQEWELGHSIPPETTLAKEYGVSRVTMRQALAELAKDGLLERRQGSGTFINQEPIPLIHDLSLPQILAGRLRERGLVTSSMIVEARTFPDPLLEVKENLQITETTPVAYLKRILLIGNKHAALNRSWFDSRLCPGITEQELIDHSLSKTLQDRYGLVPAYANNWLEVIRCTKETAELLDSALGMPMILLRSLSYLSNGTPLEYSTTEWLGDRIRFNFQSAFAHESPVPQFGMSIGIVNKAPAHSRD